MQKMPYRAPIATTMSYCGKLAAILGAKTLILMPKLKQVVTQYKIMWNEVMLWLTQVMCYKVYIQLLIRQTNNVEEI